MGAAGGAGGLVNAAMCWALHVPRGVHAARWHVVPAGFVHGAVLAVVPVVAAALANRLRGSARWLRWPVAIAAGAVAGYLAWVPVEMSFFSASLAEALTWPCDMFRRHAYLYVLPTWTVVYTRFGLVAALFGLWLARGRRASSPMREIAAACACGVAGSWWFWEEFGWYFSPVHGCIWGSLVGWAAWRAGALGGLRDVPRERHPGPSRGPRPALRATYHSRATSAADRRGSSAMAPRAQPARHVPQP